MKPEFTIFLVALVFFLHAIEEYFTGFYTEDATIQWLANFISINSLSAWLLVQVLLLVFLTMLYVFRRLKIFWFVLLLIMISELYHLIVIPFNNSLAGVTTSILFLPLIWIVYSRLAKE